MWIVDLFNTILYQPFLNLLVLIYALIPDVGIAIIILTIIIKLILHPFSVKSLKSQKDMQEVQPKIEKIRKEHKDDFQKQADEMKKIYKDHNISPLSNFLFLLIQIPIIIAILQVFMRGFGPELLNANLYSFIPVPNLSNPSLLGLLDLTKPNLILAVLAGFLQFFQTKKTMSFGKEEGGSENKVQKKVGKFTLYFFPVLTVFILSQLNAVVGLYWLTSIIFTIGEYYLLKKQIKND